MVALSCFASQLSSDRLALRMAWSTSASSRFLSPALQSSRASNCCQPTSAPSPPAVSSGRNDGAGDEMEENGRPFTTILGSLPFARTTKDERVRMGKVEGTCRRTPRERSLSISWASRSLSAAHEILFECMIGADGGDGWKKTVPDYGEEESCLARLERRLDEGVPGGEGLESSIGMRRRRVGRISDDFCNSLNETHD